MTDTTQTAVEAAADYLSTCIKEGGAVRSKVLRYLKNTFIPALASQPQSDADLLRDAREWFDRNGCGGDLVARIDARLSQPAPASDEWQPIGTAPKDGAPILAYGPLPGCNASKHGWHGVRETKWKCYPKGSPGYAAYERGEGPLGIGWDWYESAHNWSHSWRPTHWMPLPAPPLASKDQS